MTQSQQQPFVRTFIAVDFRGIQQASRARTALSIVGPIGLELIATLREPLPVPDEDDDGAEARAPLTLDGETTYGLGGEGARAAVAYATLGGLVRVSGTIGNDTAGELIGRWLSEAGVDTAGLVRSGGTPVWTLLAAPGRQTIAIRPAANAAPAVAAVEDGGDDMLGEQGSTLLLAGYPHAVAWRGPVAAAYLQQARERGVRTVVSLAPVALGGPGAQLSPADLEPLLPHVDLICGGPLELRRATRRSDAHDAARALIGGGARAVLAKRGPEGAAVFRPGPATLEREEVSTPTAALQLPAMHPVRRAAAFGAVFDAAYLLGVALNDTNPIRFAANAALRAARSDRGVMGM